MIHCIITTLHVFQYYLTPPLLLVNGMNGATLQLSAYGNGTSILVGRYKANEREASVALQSLSLPSQLLLFNCILLN